MNRIVLGAVAALLLAGAGLFWWQGRAATEQGAPPPDLPAAEASEEPLPFADGAGMRGAAPPEADPVSREQRRVLRPHVAVAAHIEAPAALGRDDADVLALRFGTFTDATAYTAF